MLCEFEHQRTAAKQVAAGDTVTQTQSAVVLENLISQFLFNKAAEGKDSKDGK